jgi:hypothetical protein
LSVKSEALSTQHSAAPHNSPNAIWREEQAGRRSCLVTVRGLVHKPHCGQTGACWVALPDALEHRPPEWGHSIDNGFVAKFTCKTNTNNLFWLKDPIDGHSAKSPVFKPALKSNFATKPRKPPPGVVHHSDRGVQYASGVYIAALREHGMVPSMSRPANPYDNASCESFMRTLKREEIRAG